MLQVFLIVYVKLYKELYFVCIHIRGEGRKVVRNDVRKITVHFLSFSSRAQLRFLSFCSLSASWGCDTLYLVFC
jgi:hypothetical protein